jgi:xanthine/CO dehydrogenase XdhC/CoxF family maturation factor
MGFPESAQSKTVKELKEIVSAAESARAKGETFALATLVKVKGSSYRRVGAKMLLTQSGRKVGAISGGCLEGDVQKKARFAMQTGNASLVIYDLLGEDESPFNFGLGCNGALALLIEPSHLPVLHERLSYYADFLKVPQPLAIATVYAAEGKLKNQIGKSLWLSEAQQAKSNICDEVLLGQLKADAHQALSQRRSQVRQYQTQNATAEALIEVLLPPIHLVIFGAGYDAVPLVEFAKALGWLVTVVARRPSHLWHEQFAAADRRLVATAKEVAEKLCVNERTAAVVMTHNFEHDMQILAQLLPLRLPYLGVLGPKARTEKLLNELKKQLALSDDLLKTLYAPVGLDIGAEFPEEIALSIVAEIKAVMQQRQGSFLRKRRAPIHDDAAW